MVAASLDGAPITRGRQSLVGNRNVIKPVFVIVAQRPLNNSMPTIEILTVV